MTGYYMAEGVESMPSVDCARKRDAFPVFHGGTSQRRNEGKKGKEEWKRKCTQIVTKLIRITWIGTLVINQLLVSSLILILWE